jgi:hypothetical protein
MKYRSGRRYYGRNKEEAVEHQLFFKLPQPLSFTYADADNGKPIGLAYLENRQRQQTGNIVVILRHEPIKNAEGVASGDITNAGGATDAQITYAVQVK